jgi:hypothetical protein
MTSGEFRLVPTESIIINREGRQRRELKGIPELAEDIINNGLIHSPVVTDGLVLVVGERRVTACLSRGISPIKVQITYETEPHRLRAIELAENIKRENIEYEEEFRAIAEIYEIRRVDNPEYSQADLAKELVYDPGYISKILATVREAASDPRIWEAPKGTTALGIVDRIKARRAEVMDELVREVLNPGMPKAPDPILNADFNEWVKTYKGPKFNFVHCDFPFGIGADSFNQGSAATHGGYPDDARTYWTLIESLCANLKDLCTEKCHFMFWFSMKNYHSTLEYFQKHSDIVFDPFPLVWTKIDNTGIMPDYRRRPRRIYETALFGARGDPRIVKPVSNAFGWSADKTSHMSIKPEEVLKYFFQMFVDGTTLMLDPTAGSGSSLRAAESLGAPYVVGLEVDKGFCEDANRAMRKARAEKEAGQRTDIAPERS